MTSRTAQCCCGQISVICAGEPVLVSRCHCTACQRRTGMPAGIAAFYRISDVAISGRSTVFARQSDSGYEVAHHFCPQCGSTVYWYPGRMPDLVAVAPGAFADPDFPPPDQDVHIESRYRWPD